jgi:hypothetical protein
MKGTAGTGVAEHLPFWPPIFTSRKKIHKPHVVPYK